MVLLAGLALQTRVTFDPAYIIMQMSELTVIVDSLTNTGLADMPSGWSRNPSHSHLPSPG